jgi:hypothetical protein
MKEITVKIPLDDSINILSFLHSAIELMRETKSNDGIEKEIMVSVVERFNLNLYNAVNNQSTDHELSTTIKMLTQSL